MPLSIQHDVFRLNRQYSYLEIPVDNVLRVQVLQSQYNLAQHYADHLLLELPVGPYVAQQIPSRKVLEQHMALIDNLDQSHQKGVVAGLLHPLLFEQVFG